MTNPGRLVVVGVPIGNPRDASAHLIETLTHAEVIAAEDTRRTKRLMTDLGIDSSARLIPYHDHNEQSRAASIIEHASAGATVALVSDAGMPGVSDPGYRLVQAAIAAQVPVTCAPGPSAVTTALVLSGLPSDRFSFEGFIARKEGDRLRQFSELNDQVRTMVFFDSPRRLGTSLATAAAVFGDDRPAAVCRELTKTYEEVLRGTLGELRDWATGKDAVLGEICVVIGGAAKRRVSTIDLIPQVLDHVADGTRMKDAVKLVAGRHQVHHRELYNAVVAYQNSTTDG